MYLLYFPASLRVTTYQAAKRTVTLSNPDDGTSSRPFLLPKKNPVQADCTVLLPSYRTTLHTYRTYVPYSSTKPQPPPTLSSLSCYPCVLNRQGQGCRGNGKRQVGRGDLFRPLHMQMLCVVRRFMGRVVWSGEEGCESSSRPWNASHCIDGGWAWRAGGGEGHNLGACVGDGRVEWSGEGNGT
ncbi:hypothetical protein EJ04DRAFT_230587 [Polyplosphaeria fusca]|uniref:Uncharacterized protein n=1 Tax=Polyplosphaeria fusca TaxID=682080 RepID=A0A9P4QVE3_9PLEO|nr:hypothetical protein EJ04DRAFT_230587 [Polyplosphaeria fusca]